MPAAYFIKVFDETKKQQLSFEVFAPLPEIRVQIRDLQQNLLSYQDMWRMHASEARAAVLLANKEDMEQKMMEMKEELDKYRKEKEAAEDLAMAELADQLDAGEIPIPGAQPVDKNQVWYVYKICVNSLLNNYRRRPPR